MSFLAKTLQMRLILFRPEPALIVVRHYRAIGKPARTVGKLYKRKIK
jgi:hypothetical protein